MAMSQHPTVSNMTLQAAINDLIDVLVEEEVSDIVNEKAYELFFGKEDEEPVEDVDPELESADVPNVDIFGQILGKKTTFEIQCPNCKRTLAAVRFAPHLEKCMGMGRNSSRIASRRLAASAGNNSSFVSTSDTPRASPIPNNGVASATETQSNNAGEIPSEDDHDEDCDDDEDWTMEKKRKGKRSTEKTTPKKKGTTVRSRRNAESKQKRASSPLTVTTYSPSSTSLDPGNDEVSNLSTNS